MKDELYVYTSSGERRELQLGADSGITLKWVSNIFNSLDKVNCSYSYTFKLPITRHNMEALDLADDLRHTSSMVRRKVKADFIQNGIPLFANANLYINQVSGGNYQCVFTFNVIDGLQKLKDDGCDLNEIGDELKKQGVEVGGLIEWGYNYVENNPLPGLSMPNRKIGNKALFNNESEALWPEYCAGIDYNGIDGLYVPPPVVPVRYLLQKIGQLYGLSFNLTTPKNTVAELNAFKESSIYEGDNLFSFGCLPLVGTELTTEQEESSLVSLYPLPVSVFPLAVLRIKNILLFDGASRQDATGLIYPTWVNVNAWAAGSPIIGDGNGMPKASEMYKYLRTSKPTNPDPDADWRAVGVCCACEVELRGSLYVRTDMEIKYDDDNKPTDETSLKLKVYRLNHWQYIKYVNLVMTGVLVSYNYWTEKEETSADVPVVIYTFNGATNARSIYSNDGNVFRYSEYYFNFGYNGYDALTFGDDGTTYKQPDHFHHYILAFSDNGNIISCVPQRTLTFYPKASDCKKITHKVDLFKNLPEIGCLDFLKSLFYMQGAFPKADSDGTISAIPYSRLRDNVKSGNVCDWSKKLIGTVEARPEDMTFKAGDFVQKNYYLTKWDDLDRTAEELLEEDDVYEDGYQCIVSENESLNDETTVYTLPYYPPYSINRTVPYRWVGNSVKFWELSDGEYQYKGIQPCYGILSSSWKRTVYKYDLTTPKLTESEEEINTEEQVKTGKNVLWMDVLNPFAKDNENWQYLQEIVRNPVTITEKMLLNEIDLRDIDFSKPIYLEKYNSYFAIVSVQRDSKGVSKCELIKLPTP